MVEICPDVCSAAFMLICTVLKRKLVGTWTERSQFAGNYRGEICGSMALALVLRAAATYLPEATQRTYTQLLILTHQQWLYRNCTVHFKTNGRSLPQHKEILQKVTALLHADEDMLLPEDQDLLHIDFAQLGNGPTIDQERWIASMNSALSAGRIHRARHGRRIRLPRIRRRPRSHHLSKQPTDLPPSSSESFTEDDEDDQPAPSRPPLQSHPYISPSYISHYFAPIPDTKGSLRYRRRRRN